MCDLGEKLLENYIYFCGETHTKTHHCPLSLQCFLEYHLSLIEAYAFKVFEGLPQKHLLFIHLFFYAFIQHLWLCIKNYALYWRFWNEKLSLFLMLSVSKMKKKNPHHSPCYEFITILAIVNWALHFNPFASMLSNMPSSKRIVNSGCFYMQNTHFKEQNFVLIFCLANLEVVHFNADAFFTFLSYMSDMFICISSRALLSLRKQNLSN